MLRIQVENIVVHSMSSESSRAIAALKSHINIHVYYSNPRLRAWQRKMTNLCSRPPNGYNFLWKYMSLFTPVLFTFSGFSQFSNAYLALLLKIPKTDEKIAVTSTMDFLYRNAIKVRWMNRQKFFPISFEDTANFSYLPNRILPPY